jgi:hypothetical protein
VGSARSRGGGAAAQRSADSGRRDAPQIHAERLDLADRHHLMAVHQADSEAADRHDFALWERVCSGKVGSARGLNSRPRERESERARSEAVRQTTPML